MYIDIFEGKFSRDLNMYIDSNRLVTIKISDISAIFDEQPQGSPHQYSKVVLSNGFRWPITQETGNKIRSLISHRFGAPMNLGEMKND